MNRILALCAVFLVPVTGFGQERVSDPRERIALNFIRPDAGRPGHHDFVNSGPWLVGQFTKLGAKWNRLAFSWVVIQPEEERFDWSAYDRIVDACQNDGIEILATLGGHFDRPPVPAWAGQTLAEVVEKHSERLEAFVRAWAERYKGKIHYYEILNEPSGQHAGLTVRAYVEGVLKPAYRIIKAVDPQAQVLPCAYSNLPTLGNRDEFWDLARGSYDIANLHVYEDWGHFRADTTAEKEERSVRNFRAEMKKHGEESKPLWITEIGWWGSASLRQMPQAAENDPELRGTFKPFYTGREYLDHPVVAREDERRAVWMRDMFPRLLAIPGCEKVFLWVSMDEFEGGWKPDALYGQATEGVKVGQVDLWGIIAGDRTWRKSALALQEMLAADGRATHADAKATTLTEKNANYVYNSWYALVNEIAAPFGKDGYQHITYHGPEDIRFAWKSAGFGFPDIRWGTQPGQYPGGKRAPGMGFRADADRRLTVEFDWRQDAASGGVYHSLISVWSFPDITEWDNRNWEIMIVAWSNNPKDFVGEPWEKLGVMTTGGITWTVLKNTRQTTVCYKNDGPQTQSVKLDVMPFVKDMIARKYLPPDWYVCEVNTGFEIWGGGTGEITIKRYSVTGPQSSGE